MPCFIKKILFPAAVFISALLIILNTPPKNNNAKIAEQYKLKSYKNTVALYKNDTIIEIYDSVVLNTLPPKDIQSFNKGICVSTPLEAELLLEDYDG